MTAGSQPPREVQYIVAPRKPTRDAGDSVNPLQRLLQLASSTHTDVTIVSAAGSQGNPRRLVIRGPPERIAELRSIFGDELLFEEDAFLQFP